MSKVTTDERIELIPYFMRLPEVRQSAFLAAMKLIDDGASRVKAFTQYAIWTGVPEAEAPGRALEIVAAIQLLNKEGPGDLPPDPI